MEVTETRVFLKEGADKKLKAYATVTFDNAFVVRNIKIIQGLDGLFIAMPSRKLKISCTSCYNKNDVGSAYCNKCGKTLPTGHDVPTDEPASREQHRDIAHPITKSFREYLEAKVLDAYQQETQTGFAVASA